MVHSGIFLSLQTRFRKSFRASDNARALNEIQLAFSNVLLNLGKLVPVERRHVTPPAITT